jgi:hypothetical protein
MKSCLLIIQRKFYSFETQIAQELRKRGYEIECANDEYPDSMLGRIIGKLQIPFIFYWTRREFRRRFLNGRRYDLVLIFKGRGLSVSLVDELRAVSSRVVGYNWDSFSVNPSARSWWHRCTSYFTFDYADAERYGIPVCELFSAAEPIEPVVTRVYEVSAVFRNHSGRLRHLDEVLTILAPRRYAVSVFERDFFTFVYNLVRSPRLYWKYRASISFKSLPYSEYSRLLRESEFVVDYANDCQTGLTMRCFEALSARTKLITNNPRIAESAFFASTDYIVHPVGADPFALRHQYGEKRRVSFASRPRSIADFISDLVSGRGNH